MNGIVSVTVKDSRNSYNFQLKRNITILSGESGRGKTTLYDMIYDYNRYGKESGIKVVCDRNVIAIDGNEWREKIDKIKNSVIVIDEDNSFIRSKDFAKIIDGNSNYFLLITRAYLSTLPFSVDEIYEISGNKNKKFIPVYTAVNHMYNNPKQSALPFRPEVIITEDSKSGYQFFSTLTSGKGIECISANGKSNIIKKLLENRGRKVLIIADGAAFGTEIREIVQRQNMSPNNIAIFLPESFEWLILKSGLVNDPEWEKVTYPEKYIYSEKFISWERYFTYLLVDITKDREFQRYPSTKSELPKFYTHDNSVKKIRKVMSEVDI